MNPTSLLIKSAQIYGDRVAFVCEDRRQTYTELRDRAARFANTLRDAGVRPGERVAVLSDNAIEALEQVVGLAIGGFVRCALYAHEPAEKNLYLLQLTGASALVVQDKHYSAIASVLAQAPDVRVVVVVGEAPDGVRDYETALAEASAELPDVQLRPDDPHLIRFSSGTTGMPKGILHTVRGWMELGNEFALVFGGFATDDRYIAATPYTHAAGLMAWPLLSVGATTVVMPSFDPGAWLDIVERDRITFAILPPTVIQMLVNMPGVERRDLSSLRKVVYGSAPISETTLVAALRLWGNIMYQTFGQSEAMPITCLTPEHHIPDGTSEQRSWLRSAGRPTPNSVVRIVDDDGNDVPQGEVGEIVAQCMGTMHSIWGDPEATTQRFLPGGWLRTRDMGYLTTDGFLFLADRKEDMIISGGFNIWPMELENAMAAHPAVAEVAVVGVPHPKWGETPHAAIVLRPGIDATEEELVAWSREKVGSIKKITGVTFTDSLPKSPIGKVLRRAVREQHVGGTPRIAGA
ncbi:Acyl-CoA synthetase (AMP-forming)/AMP-acid ligase II [Amycolatopsis marina]|uniref:Acyl-CoA synthetase (AMP-forming)/AMP-acid ligase II n=1 Tax=Amycolatopsis marina TaxID=490629 RepID=A0A1I0YIF6_9PSEU|nr:AMP-binding protein [Amycolatopsis marina]SFB13149.1 Acyl-CoA synthetase (AMP-forming)/AMP-acid ligase II [Amycolatopsis marina]